MKKILITVLAASLIAVSTSACGNSSDSESATENTIQITTARGTTAAATTAAAQSTTAAQTTAATTEAKATAAATTAQSSKSESSSRSEAKSSASSSEQKSQQSSQSSSASSSSKSTASSAAKTTSASYSDSDASVTYKGVTLKIDSVFSSSSLGTPDAKQVINNCLTGGSGYAYVYGSLTIDVYTSGSSEYIESIFSEDMSSVTTSKGITGGSSTSDLTNAYGTPSSSDSGMYTYNASGTTAMFYLSGGSVTGVCITKN